MSLRAFSVTRSLKRKLLLPLLLIGAALIAAAVLLVSFKPDSGQSGSLPEDTLKAAEPQLKSE